MTRQPSEPLSPGPLVPGQTPTAADVPLGASSKPQAATGSATPAVGKSLNGSGPVDKPSDEDDVSAEGAPHRWLQESASLLVSTAIHTIVFLILLLIPLTHYIREGRFSMEVGQTGSDTLDEIKSASNLDGPVSLPTTFEHIPGELGSGPNLDQPALDQPVLDQPQFGMADSGMRSDAGLHGAVPGVGIDLLKSAGTGGLGGLDGRGTPERRAALAKAGGGNDASEQAVNRALRWLAVHQLADGGWTFDLMKCPNCRGKCKNSGHMDEARIGATAMALLPFLGAGQTHKKGEYQKEVHAGLYFLITRMKTTNTEIGSLHEPGGRMYSHGLATIVLCEAFGMTDDRAFLMRPAQRAINYIVFAQDPDGGGWRYDPHEPGDTSVVGWQLMALKSAEMAYLNVPQETLRKASRFLDYVQADFQSDNYSSQKFGVAYGYTDARQRCDLSTTSIGLLCRLYLGWKYDNPALMKGSQLLSEYGPSNNELHRIFYDIPLGIWQKVDRPPRRGPEGPVTDMYYNYYATQFLHNIGGENWKKWNATMRDFLVSTQSQDEHESGSWYMNDVHGSLPGGRLYCTALATMILEVYYRYMPLYQQQTFKDDFPVVK